MNVVCFSTDPELETILRDSFASDDAVTLTMQDKENPDAAVLADADAVLCGALSPELRARMPKLRYIQYWSAGVDGKLFPELWNNDAQVCTGSGIHAASCSEHILSLMLAFARGLPIAFDAQRAHDWNGRRADFDKAVFELEGKTVGIVGAGVIGQAIGVRCKAFGMRTVGTRRDVSRPTEGIDILLPHIQYHDLILESDMIVLALPLTNSTQMLFGEDEIEIIRPRSYVFNIGRGGLVDETWLLRALQRNWIAGAGLDVFVDEPLPIDSPFWDLPNCIITPHVGGLTPNYWPRFARLVSQQLERLSKNEPLTNRVSRELGY